MAGFCRLFAPFDCLAQAAALRGGYTLGEASANAR